MSERRSCIVIAWGDWTGLRKTGRMERFDGYNYRPAFEPAPEGRACIWTLDGDEDSFQAANTYAATIQAAHPIVAVLRYPVSEEDPLGKARARMESILEKEGPKE